MKNLTFIGIGGCSRSGKTTLTHHIKDAAIEADLRFKCIHQDELILPEEQLPRIRDRVDWEVLTSLDTVKQQEVIEDAFSRKDIIVIEGLFIHPQFMPKLDYFIYLEVDEATFLDRRRAESRWGEEDEWYLDYVWKQHQIFYAEKISPFMPAESKNTLSLDITDISDSYKASLINSLISGEALLGING